MRFLGATSHLKSVKPLTCCSLLDHQLEALAGAWSLSGDNISLRTAPVSKSKCSTVLLWHGDKKNRKKKQNENSKNLQTKLKIFLLSLTIHYIIPNQSFTDLEFLDLCILKKNNCLYDCLIVSLKIIKRPEMPFELFHNLSWPRCSKYMTGDFMTNTK